MASLKNTEEFSAVPGAGVSQQGLGVGAVKRVSRHAWPWLDSRRTPGPEAGLEASSHAAGSLWSLHKGPRNARIMYMF